MMNLNKARKIIVLGFCTILIVCVCGFAWIRGSIQTGLDKMCEVAQANHPHPDDDIAALMDYVQSSSHTLRERDMAVWALGQARDRRALPVLETLYTGGKCDHEHDLCQGELSKAIELLKNEPPNVLFIRTP